MRGGEGIGWPDKRTVRGSEVHLTLQYSTATVTVYSLPMSLFASSDKKVLSRLLYVYSLI